ncbi:hypothetical protein BD413DRAFT_507953 [Trametes elegans]|nr:hypothetical protein BD413DRAFT_507953 [Trametes elegans]
MPRRARPATRKPPQRAASSATQRQAALVHSATKSRSTRKPAEPTSGSESEFEHQSPSEDSEEDPADSGSGSGSDDEQNDYEIDAEPDAPRVAQWMDEEELEEISDEESESAGSEDDEADNKRLEADLKALPFGALRKAQKALAKTQSSDESGDEDEDSNSGSEPDDVPSFARASHPDKGKEREELREKKQVPKRKNKHAPMEMSSKRPVSRSRFVAEEKVVPRDPRFLPITGEFDPKRFQTQYGFLAEMHENEMKTLKDNLKRARKLLANSPRDLREEREAEVERLERAVKRAESAVNRDRQERVQIEALSKATKEERDRQKEGKKAWYMKNADKKALLLRAKYDALATTGGRGAVKKAIEKKQKKVNQKEKKKRPFVSGPPPRISGEAGPSARNGSDSRPQKRSRTS